MRRTKVERTVNIVGSRIIFLLCLFVVAFVIGVCVCGGGGWKCWVVDKDDNDDDLSKGVNFFLVVVGGSDGYEDGGVCVVGVVVVVALFSQTGPFGFCGVDGKAQLGDTRTNKNVSQRCAALVCIFCACLTEAITVF